MGEARAAIVIAHDLGEHSGRYENLARDFARAGMNTYALDNRGHGRSDGKRGHVRRFMHYIQDFERLRRRVQGAVSEDLPLFLLGHGLGGLIVFRYLEEYPGVGVRGAILSAPMLGAPLQITPGRERLTRMLRYVAPALPVSTGLDPASLSEDPEVVASYRRDPMVHDRVTPRLFCEADREIETAVEKQGRIRTPVLWLLAVGDQVVRSDLIARLAAALDLQVEGSQIRRYSGVHHHELLQEASQSGAVADLLGWIERRLAV